MVHSRALAMAAATVVDLQTLLTLQAHNAESLRILANQQQAAMETLMTKAARPASTSCVDSRGVGRPSSFKGEEKHFAEWIAKFAAFLKSS